MRYIKLFLSTILAILIAGIVVWASLFLILFSALAAPLIAWWSRRKANIEIISVKTSENKTENQESYKVIEAKYEIIEK